MLNLVSKMWSFYKKFNVSFAEIEEFINVSDIEKIKENLKNYDLIGSIDHFSDKIEYMYKLINYDELLPCSLGHGDLSTGNMILSNDEIYLVDWEKSRRMPIAFDMGKLAISLSEVADLCELENQKLSGESKKQIFSFRNQLSIYAMNRLKELPRLKKYYMEIIGLDEKKTNSKIRNKVLDWLELI